MVYEVIVTRTGSIAVEAKTEEEAYDKVLDMSTREIDEEGNLTGWEPSDVLAIGEY